MVLSHVGENHSKKKKKNVARNSDFSCNPFHDQCHDIYSRNEAKGSEKAHFEIIIIIFF